MAHLGPRVSALLDGRLPTAEEERCWAHVHECHACRDLVEREGWVKTRLAQLSLGPAAASESLKVSLRQQAPHLLPPELPPVFPPASRFRSRSLVAIGGGAASAAVVGVLALGVGGPARVDPPPPTTELSRPVGPVAPPAPAVDVERRRTAPLPSSRAPRGGRVALFHEKMPS